MDFYCRQGPNRARILLPGALAALALSNHLTAQESTTPQDMSGKLEPIVVTAERRSTDLQLAPIAATVLSGDDLTKLNVNTIDSLMFTTPSLTVQSSGENALINIRGIGKSDAGAQDSSGVLIYRDGVSTTPNGLISDEPYYDIASVEVLRGPQGTFAGQNATGGAIFINEANPTLDRFGGWVEGQIGNYEDARVRAAINIPLSQQLAIRIATDDENRDTFFNMSGPYTGNPGKLHSTNWRLSTLWKPDDDFTALLKFDYNYINHGGSPAGPFTGLTQHVFDVASDSYLAGYERQYRVVLQLSERFADDIQLKSISGYQVGKLSYSLDADGTATPPPAGLSPEIFVASADDRTMSEEVNLVSSNQGPFTWVAGGVYQIDNLNTPQFILSLAPGGTQTTGLALNGLQDTAIRTSWGIFAQGGYAITDQLKLNAGARYSETSFVVRSIAQGLFYGIPLTTETLDNAKQSDSRLTYKVDLDYTLDEHNFLYAFVATGHKGGGINANGNVFSPEDVKDYELGWKGTFFAGHLKTQFGGFYDDYKNFQLAIFDPVLSAGVDANATGTTTLKGIEAQMQAAVGGLSFDLGTSYVATRLGQFSAIDQRSLALGDQVLTGRPLPNAPLWTAQAGVQYSIDLGNHQALTPRVDYSLVGSRWATAFQVVPSDFLQEQNIFNAQIKYDYSDTLAFTLFGTNITNDHYVSLQLLGNLGMPGPPRQYGLRVFKSF
ncbi:MAG TPA: TonB-dependent receptor [Steroidobacteraceae bacterium]|jgi:iron complex outermembrane receptor protein|nr:TonB-dependent receptor [Steroidobacteraceae bacterium]